MFQIHDGNQAIGDVIDETVLRLWLREGKVTPATLILRQGETRATPLKELPEFRPDFPQPPTPPPLNNSKAPDTRRTSRLAIASLVCGILALPTLGIAGIVGTGLGIAALVSLGRNRATLKGEMQAIFGLVLSAGFLLTLPITAALILPALAKAKQRAQTITCVNQMKQVALAIRIYSSDHKGQYPEDLKSLSDSLNSPKLLVCPRDGSRAAGSKGLTWEGLKDEDSSYEFLRLGAKEGTSPSQTVLLRCPICGNEGMEDGSVHLPPRR